MRYLVTGGAGFLGSHLVETLVGRGHQVAVLDDFSTGRRSNLASVLDAPGFELVPGTVEEAPELPQLVRRADRVLHLAAAVGVRLVLHDPAAAAVRNVRAAERLLRLAARRGLPTLVTSSSEVYGQGARVPFGEDDPLLVGTTAAPRWSYAVGKVLVEQLASAFHRSHALPVTVARLFNTVGPRQRGRFGMVLPRFVSRALRGRAIPVYGDGHQTRTFLHVGDLVPALLDLLEAPDARGRAVNLGGREEVTIRALADRVVEELGSRSRVATVPYERAFGAGFEETRRRRPALALAARLIGFEPRRTLSEMIRETAEKGSGPFSAAEKGPDPFSQDDVAPALRAR
jgi:UDP-glucose 4-epimerase